MTRNQKIIFFIVLLCGILYPMADPVWGLLAKSLSDAQLISEAIDSAITAHNDDPDAHLGAGQSLQSHRAAEIIDHEAASIVPDKFNSSNNSIIIPVNSLDALGSDNFSNVYVGAFTRADQNTGLSGNATVHPFDIQLTDFAYNGGDVLYDLIFDAFGSSGTWQAQFSTGFARIEMKAGYYRLGWFTSTWQYGSWVALPDTTTARWRIHFDAVNGKLLFYRNGVLIQTQSYTLDVEFDESIADFLLNRGTSTSSSIVFGNMSFAFDSTT